MRYVMNDYELVYLIQNEQDDIAMAFMFKKYHKFIWKQVHLLNVDPKEHDDLHQEGVLMLHKALQTFDETKNKSFTRYFELILRRQLYKAKNNIPNYYLYEHTDFCKGVTYLEEEPIEIICNSLLEQQIHQLYFLERRSVAEIIRQTEYSKKQIYNTIFRIKEKYKNML
ncbi:MAG: sigma-70 family RNA polymerase sigma factor [Acholeplasmataceae bacterium]|nr:sigma-70 family RNA polymerase sigma factor [Acholeplasmataceae bacterium]